MKVRIFNGTVAVEARLQAHLTRRLDFALGGFGDRVGRISVRLSNGEAARGGPVKRCAIEVVMRPRSVSVMETGSDLFIAVENASHRLKRSVARALEREQAWSNGHRAPHASPPTVKASANGSTRKVGRRRARRVLPA